MKNILLGVFLATLLVFMWGFVFWGMEIVPVFDPVAEEEALGQALVDLIPESGVYLIPHSSNAPDMETAIERQQAGPFAMIFIVPGGISDPMSPMTFILGFLHMLAMVSLLAALLRLVGPTLPSYGARLGAILLVGVTVIVWANLGMPIWWHHPWNHWILISLYDIVAFLLAGLVLAHFIRPPSHPIDTAFAHSAEGTRVD